MPATFLNIYSLFTSSFTEPLTHSTTNSLMNSFTCSFMHSLLTHSLNKLTKWRPSQPTSRTRSLAPGSYVSKAAVLEAEVDTQPGQDSWFLSTFQIPTRVCVLVPFLCSSPDPSQKQR